MSPSCGLKRHRAKGHLKTPSVFPCSGTNQACLCTLPSSTLVAEPTPLYGVFNSPHYSLFMVIFLKGSTVTAVDGKPELRVTHKTEKVIQ